MSTFGVKLPDVGEGVAEAELISWLVSVGDRVTPDSVLAEVMTDKATVEVASPVTGLVTALRGEPGDVLAVGSELVVVELDGDAPAPRTSAPAPTTPAAPPASDGAAVDSSDTDTAPPPASTPASVRTSATRALAAPAVRARAQRLGLDLSTITGSGPDGRVLHDDLDRRLTADARRPARSGATEASDGTRTEAVRGLRRRIAQRLTQSWTEIPHITYVEAVDATDLEALRAELNRRRDDGTRLTLLPFLIRAIVLACDEQPRLNTHYDATTETLTFHDAVHVGIATQTPDGLVVPVVRHAERRGLWDLAGEIARVSGATRAGTATRDELGGSTITITSLGALGGLVTTPIINQPEVAIIGVNKIETRPVWRDGAVVPRQVLNLSSSFDHRVVDGWDAATFVQRIRSLLEMPALLFVDDHG